MLIMTQTEYQQKIKTLLPKLLARINATALPLTVPVRPEPDANINSCFYNVERKIGRDGGSNCYGWAIRFSPYIIEAEKHAVWKSPTDEYLDITPNELNSQSVYFVVDHDFSYNGQLVDNIRLNVTGERVVDDWIMVSETIHVLYSYGQRTGEQELRMPENIAKVIQSLEQCANVFAPFLAAGGTYQGSCFCGRALAYDQCHGLNLKTSLGELLIKAADSMKDKTI